jgi:hypothetical protein
MNECPLIAVLEELPSALTLLRDYVSISRPGIIETQYRFVARSPIGRDSLRRCNSSLMFHSMDMRMCFDVFRLSRKTMTQTICKYQRIHE